MLGKLGNFISHVLAGTSKSLDRMLLTLCAGES